MLCLYQRLGKLVLRRRIIRTHAAAVGDARALCQRVDIADQHDCPIRAVPLSHNNSLPLLLSRVFVLFV